MVVMDTRGGVTTTKLTRSNGAREFAAAVAKAKRATRNALNWGSWDVVVRDRRGDVVKVGIENGEAYARCTRRRRTDVSGDVLLVAMRCENIGTFEGRRA